MLYGNHLSYCFVVSWRLDIWFYVPLITPAMYQYHLLSIWHPLCNYPALDLWLGLAAASDGLTNGRRRRGGASTNERPRTVRRRLEVTGTMWSWDTWLRSRLWLIRILRMNDNKRRISIDIYFRVSWSRPHDEYRCFLLECITTSTHKSHRQERQTCV